MALCFVSAKAQSEAALNVMEFLNEEELCVYKRGRNTKSTPSKNAVVSEYRRATGFEALFGYLFLLGESKRIEELFLKAYENKF